MKQYRAPNGLQIVGACSTVPRCCFITGFNEDGTVEFSDRDEVYWDADTPSVLDGKELWQDEMGNEWTLDECTPFDDEQEEAA